MHKRNFVKAGWVIIILGSICLAILFGIEYGVRQNQSEYPSYTTTLLIIAGSSYVLGFALIVIAPMIKKS